MQCVCVRSRGPNLSCVCEIELRFNTRAARPANLTDNNNNNNNNDRQFRVLLLLWR